MILPIYSQIISRVQEINYVYVYDWIFLKIIYKNLSVIFWTYMYFTYSRQKYLNR